MKYTVTIVYGKRIVAHGRGFTLTLGTINGIQVGVRGQRGDRKIQGRQKMCRDRK